MPDQARDFGFMFSEVSALQDQVALCRDSDSTDDAVSNGSKEDVMAVDRTEPAQAPGFTFSEANAALQGQVALCRDSGLTEDPVSRESKEDVMDVDPTEPTEPTDPTNIADNTRVASATSAYDSTALLTSRRGTTRQSRGLLDEHQVERLVEPDKREPKSHESGTDACIASASDHAASPVSKRRKALSELLSRIQNGGGDRNRVHGLTSQVSGVKRTWATMTDADLDHDPELIAAYQNIMAECEDIGSADSV
jgi:hypothetical protein